MFQGVFHHSIDAKGRTSLPSKFREQLAGQGADKLFITRDLLDPCLVAFAPALHNAVITPGLIPVTAVLLGFLVLGQRPGPMKLAGIALILAGSQAGTAGITQNRNSKIAQIEIDAGDMAVTGAKTIQVEVKE